MWSDTNKARKKWKLENYFITEVREYLSGMGHTSAGVCGGEHIWQFSSA